MTFLESMLFLILYVGLGAGIPLIWYVTRTGRRERNEGVIVDSSKTFEQAHAEAVERVK